MKKTALRSMSNNYKPKTYSYRKNFFKRKLSLLLLGVLSLAAVIGFLFWNTPEGLALSEEAIIVSGTTDEERASALIDSLFTEGRSPSEMPASVCLDVACLMQNPELPTGCESVALTNALLFYGFDLEKTTIADRWLPLSNNDFVYSFLGNPRDPNSNSCMAPCIVQTANAYLEEQGSNLQAFDLTGTSFEELLLVVSAGNPVVVWSSINLMDIDEPYATQVENGSIYHLYEGSHCVVLSGYDQEKDTVYVSDSLVGKTYYSLAEFSERYCEMGSQAVCFSS